MQPLWLRRFLFVALGEGLLLLPSPPGSARGEFDPVPCAVLLFSVLAVELPVDVPVELVSVVEDESVVADPVESVVEEPVESLSELPVESVVPEVFVTEEFCPC